ncbi:VOC family protein [Dietzia psychralcaliphila]|uniref:VOC family protein n=1 Tax=Dietzia psychralcaliphila TaxID=139021 RepID=UPI001C1E5FAE|nr:VOC family protein [Dietzia psychralcaliphila]
MSTHQPGSTPAPTVWHCLQCTDARAVIDWLVEALGFVETVSHTEGGTIVHAELLWPEGGGVMLGDRQRDPDDPHATPVGTGLAYVVTADSDVVYERARAAGAEIVMEMRDTDYGDHGFSVRDPEGNVWSVGQYRGEPLPHAIT